MLSRPWRTMSKLECPHSPASWLFLTTTSDEPANYRRGHREGEDWHRRIRFAARWTTANQYRQHGNGSHHPSPWQAWTAWTSSRGSPVRHTILSTDTAFLPPRLPNSTVVRQFSAKGKGGSEQCNLSSRGWSSPHPLLLSAPLPLLLRPSRSFPSNKAA